MPTSSCNQNDAKLRNRFGQAKKKNDQKFNAACEKQEEPIEQSSSSSSSSTQPTEEFYSPERKRVVGNTPLTYSMNHKINLYL
jgi:hypothetical protein